MEEEVAQAVAVGPIDALKAKELADGSLKAAKETKLPGLHNGKGDAFRHALWSCEMTKEIGADQAETVGNIHEKYGKNPPGETAMDLKNNAVGRQLAVEGGENCDCKKSVWDALEKGKLQTSPGQETVTPKIKY